MAYTTQKTRKFGGKTYQRRFHFGLKGQATQYAKTERQKGRKARVAQHAGVYTVYSRE